MDGPAAMMSLNVVVITARHEHAISISGSYKLIAYTYTGCQVGIQSFSMHANPTHPSTSHYLMMHPLRFGNCGKIVQSVCCRVTCLSMQAEGDVLICVHPT